MIRRRLTAIAAGKEKEPKSKIQGERMHTAGMDITKIKELCKKAITEDELIAIRREFHKYPELSAHEYETMERIAGLLDKWGVAYEKGVADTGLLVRMQGKYLGHNIALRADMDALACQEKNDDLSFASCRDGVMHACGHDMHMTILLGAVKFFKSLNGDFPGNVTFIFQPDEEGDGGAARMIAAGCLENPHIEHALGLHVDPSIPCGHIGVVYGKMYAASDMIDIRIYGKSSHGAQPQNGIDAIVIAANIINALQTIVSRNTDPTDSVACTIGKIQGGTVRNQVAEYVELSGIIRSMTQEKRLEVRKRAQMICEQIASSMGGRAEFIVHPGYNPLITDRMVTDVVIRKAKELLGESSVILEPGPQLTVEDFAYYATERPSGFYHLGCAALGNEKTAAPLHNSSFRPDENCLMTGVMLQAAIAMELLEKGAG